MIIDFITTCSSIIKVSNYSSINYNMKTDYYTIKTANDIKSWRLEDDYVSEVHFIFISPNVKNLKEIEYNLVGSLQNADIKIKMETSLDYINWSELDYVINSKDSEKKYVYKVIKTETDVQYYNTTLKNVIKSSDIDPSSLTYAFTKYNDFSKEVSYIYDNLEWKYLKISLSNIPPTSNSPLFFTKLNVIVEEELDDDCIDTHLLECKSPMFTKPKVYEEFEFFPDILANYLKMLEEKNKMHDTRNFTHTCLCNDISSLYPDPEGIGNDIIGLDTVIYL